MNYEVTFNLYMDRLKMLKVGLSCIWHSILGTGYVHFHEVGCNDLVDHLKELEGDK